MARTMVEYLIVVTITGVIIIGGGCAIESIGEWRRRRGQMPFINHEESLERSLTLVESERGEVCKRIVLLVSARVIAVELRRLRAENDQLRKELGYASRNH